MGLTCNSFSSGSGFISQALSKLRAGGRYFHAICNLSIDLDGDRAAVESYFIALQVTAAAPTRETFLAGRYVDRFEQREGEWRIAARTVVYDWLEERERPELAEGDARFGLRLPVGAPFPSDTIYGVLRVLREKGSS